MLILLTSATESQSCIGLGAKESKPCQVMTNEWEFTTSTLSSLQQNRNS